MATVRPWATDEHKRFLEALERFGSGQTGNEWKLMAEYVGTRTYNEIKLHAHKYFLKLQTASQSKRAPETEQLDDGNWTYDEDMAFENALALHDEGDPDRWNHVAAMLPGKSAADVRKRYQKLLLDIATIEAGKSVTIIYKPAPPSAPSSVAAAAAAAATGAHGGSAAAAAAASAAAAVEEPAGLASMPVALPSPVPLEDAAAAAGGGGGGGAAAASGSGVGMKRKREGLAVDAFQPSLFSPTLTSPSLEDAYAVLLSPSGSAPSAARSALPPPPLPPS